MSKTLHHELDKSPSLVSLFSKAIKPKNLSKQGFPSITASLKSLKADKSKVKAYSQVCGFSPSNTLPVSYPHILAFPLHLKILTSNEFPFPLLGLVHVSNEISQYRPIEITESLDYACSLTESRQVEKGTEFDIHTQVTANGELLWESTSTMLKRKQITSSSNKAAPAEAIDFNAQHIDQWKVDSNIGRRYARVSGDFNFIHLHKISAMLFGFNHAIAHGMWSKARTIASLESQLPNEAFKIAVKFKLPLFLPAKVQLQSKTNEAGEIKFQLMDSTGEKPHLAGQIIPIEKP